MVLKFSITTLDESVSVITSKEVTITLDCTAVAVEVKVTLTGELVLRIKPELLVIEAIVLDDDMSKAKLIWVMSPPVEAEGMFIANFNAERRMLCSAVNTFRSNSSA